MNDPVEWLRPVIFLVALLFVGMVVVWTIRDAAHQRRQVEMWLKNSQIENQDKSSCTETSVCPARCQGRDANASTRRGDKVDYGKRR